ncbi:MAG TPA: sigma-54 dependent transcriptional regulator [Lacipirellulaceae bacterium]|nr:sigma-54 dependent transcriptional regulator [Lacipirellulaceae bacterium]
MGHIADVAASAEQGLEMAAAASPDLLILDVRLPGMDGLTAMEAFGSRVNGAPIVIITAFGDLATAVDAVCKGAFEYVVKPFDLASIRAVIERALRVVPKTISVGAEDNLDGMLGQSQAMQSVFKKIALAANSDASVLLEGESGVGKELAAQAIHRHSVRKLGPMVAVNMAALSPALADAELFGHVEGAFTGAMQQRTGLLLQANGGTLFLDEVADIPLPLQLKLLRVLDHGEVLPVGADAPVRSRFRVISATHQNLRKKVEAGEFRHDLYFRLCTFEIHLPALRERPEDISLLAHHFAARIGSHAAVLADETMAELQRRPWYGNVRELRNAIEHALVLARRGLVMPEHLPPPLPNLWQAGDAAPALEGDELAVALSRIARNLAADPNLAGTVYDRFLQQVERPLLTAVMDKCGKRFAPAARVLGLHRTTLKKKLTQYEMAEDSTDG